jgi:hypothetical protein
MPRRASSAEERDGPRVSSCPAVPCSIGSTRPRSARQAGRSRCQHRDARVFAEGSRPSACWRRHHEHRASASEKPARGPDLVRALVFAAPARVCCAGSALVRAPALRCSMRFSRYASGRKSPFEVVCSVIHGCRAISRQRCDFGHFAAGTVRAYTGGSAAVRLVPPPSPPRRAFFLRARTEGAGEAPRRAPNDASAGAFDAERALPATSGARKP